MKKIILAVVLGFLLLAGSGASADDCDRCLDLINNSETFTPDLRNRLGRCTENLGSNCQFKVSKAVYDKFRVIIDFFQRRQRQEGNSGR